MAQRRAERRRTAIHKANVAMATATLCMVLLAACYLWLTGGPRHVAMTAIGGPFTLTQSNGRVVTQQNFHGKYMLIYFGYTSCPDVCPTTLSAIADAMDLLGDRADRLQPLFITVDPKRDSPTIMRNYVMKFSPDIVGLSGTPTQIHGIEREYHITSIVRPDPQHRDDYAVDHTAVLFLMGPDGHYLQVLSALASGHELANKLAPYLGS
jgi:cytochrome oxidase Cu insertion factor (SCO1/SenC/PrrC family)